MNSILEDLFLGRIDIMETLTVKKQSSTSDKESFIKTLTTEQQEQYEKIENAFMERCALEYQECFISGFKTAVRMILESL